MVALTHSVGGKLTKFRGHKATLKTTKVFIHKNFLPYGNIVTHRHTHKHTHTHTQLGKLLYESNILHITSYSHKKSNLKSNLKVTYYFIKLCYITIPSKVIIIM